MYVDDQDGQGDSKIIFDSANVPAFGSQEVRSDEFETIQDQFVFMDPIEIENLQSDILECLLPEASHLATLTIDLAIKGFWPLLVQIINIAEMKLKMSTLKLLTSLMKRNCIVKQPRILFMFVSLVFQLVKEQVSENEAVFSEVLRMLWKCCQKNSMLMKICHQETLGLWNRLSESDSFADFPKEMVPFVVEIMKDTKINVETLDKILNANLEGFEEVIAQSVIQEINLSQQWILEKEKLDKIERGVKT